MGDEGEGGKNTEIYLFSLLLADGAFTFACSSFPTETSNQECREL